MIRVMANVEKPPKHRGNMPDWGNAPVWWQNTVIKGHWAAFLCWNSSITSSYTKHHNSLQQGGILHCSLARINQKHLSFSKLGWQMLWFTWAERPGTVGGTPGGQVQAGSQTWHLQARSACPRDLASPPVWHNMRTLTQLQHTKCTLPRERYSAPTSNWELPINSLLILPITLCWFRSALKSCFKTSDSS